MIRLRCENYSLRTIEENDLELILKWRNSERIRSCMFTDHIITLKEHIDWFSKIKHDSRFVFKMFELEGIPVGIVNFTQIDKVNNKCSWGFYLGEENLPPGTGTAMGFLGLDYAFEKMAMQKICGEVLETNKSSIRFHKKWGFLEEDRLSNHIFKNGVFIDVILFSLSNHHWYEHKADFELLLS